MNACEWNWWKEWHRPLLRLQIVQVTLLMREKSNVNWLQLSSYHAKFIHSWLAFRVKANRKKSKTLQFCANFKSAIWKWPTWELKGFEHNTANHYDTSRTIQNDLLSAKDAISQFGYANTIASNLTCGYFPFIDQFLDGKQWAKNKKNLCWNVLNPHRDQKQCNLLSFYS